MHIPAPLESEPSLTPKLWALSHLRAFTAQPDPPLRGQSSVEALLRRRSWTRPTGQVLERGGGGYRRGLGWTQATDGLDVKAPRMQHQVRAHFRPLHRLSLAASGPRCSVQRRAPGAVCGAFCCGARASLQSGRPS